MNRVPSLYRNLINPWQTQREIDSAARYISCMIQDLIERQCQKTGTYRVSPDHSAASAENYRYWQTEINTLYRLDQPDRVW